jgi:hypothetical protein
MKNRWAGIYERGFDVQGRPGDSGCFSYKHQDDVEGLGSRSLTPHPPSGVHGVKQGDRQRAEQ